MLAKVQTLAQVVIENPILNSPFEEPCRHFRFGKTGITNDIVSARRTSAYFIPIAQPKRKGAQARLPATEWTEERIQENELINRIRQRVKLWRSGGYAGVTTTTARLLEHWRNPERERRLFICQIKAVWRSVQDGQAWRFPDVLRISQAWLRECVTCKDGTFPQLLLFTQLAHNAADRIYRAIVKASEAERVLKPILRPYDTFGSTRYVDFDTTKPTLETRPDKCHVSHVVADTGTWEQKLAETLEDMPEVIRYVKNQNLGFTIPYTVDGEPKNYIPDFIAVIDLTRVPGAPVNGPSSFVNLILEVTGERKKDKEAKVQTARTLWVPAVNNHGGLGRWAFVEVTDPWGVLEQLRTSEVPR